ncbi:SDR family NAD(P)-dependent oxidoreductase [Fodinicola acaciae]|uniref:SDR family NAD(P)-dependent oxidoreductase n=1 Tax=Fodinicola acaciae TaxID=2681555 RepID=UPI0013D43661|nr:SDR family NAD(P)-dependent oxidoreductase [Fodinicola acaciae]
MATVKDLLARPLIRGITTSPVSGWLVNPHASVSERRLRQAVAGRIVVITGASYGLGEATARRLGAAGAVVLMLARTAEALEQTAALIRDAGGTAYAYPTDLTDTEQVAETAKKILDEHGHVDVIVHNAGKSIRRSVRRSYDRFHDYTRTIDVNYLGPVKLTLELLPSMRARGRGHLVNVSTIGVRIPPGPRWSAYQASKSAFDVFFRSMATEAAADGITTSTIYMALMFTRMSAPTGIFDNLPGLTADQAAGLVCKAIVDRPAKISPWWAEAAHTAFAPAQEIWGGVVARLYRQGRR